MKMSHLAINCFQDSTSNYDSVRPKESIICQGKNAHNVTKLGIHALVSKQEKRASQSHSKWQSLLEVVGVAWFSCALRSIVCNIYRLTSKLKVNSDNKLPERGWSVPHLECVSTEGVPGKSADMRGWFLHIHILPVARRGHFNMTAAYHENKGLIVACV